MWWRWL